LKILKGPDAVYEMFCTERKPNPYWLPALPEIPGHHVCGVPSSIKKGTYLWYCFEKKILCRFAQSYSSKQILKQQLENLKMVFLSLRVTVGMPSRVVKSVKLSNPLPFYGFTLSKKKDQNIVPYEDAFGYAAPERG
jgi:hypothetical protein